MAQRVRDLSSQPELHAEHNAQVGTSLSLGCPCVNFVRGVIRQLLREQEFGVTSHDPAIISTLRHWKDILDAGAVLTSICLDIPAGAAAIAIQTWDSSDSPPQQPDSTTDYHNASHTAPQ